MKHHFNLKTFPGVNYQLPLDVPQPDEKYQKYCIDLVKDLEYTMNQFQIKLGAAYARLRIEKGAAGDNAFEQMNNVLPESVRTKEYMAVEMLKTLRINTLRCTPREIADRLESVGYRVFLSKISQVPVEIKS
jgi:hypothetical protein